MEVPGLRIEHKYMALYVCFKVVPASRVPKTSSSVQDARGKTQVARMVSREGLLKPSSEVPLRPELCHAKIWSYANYLDINTQ